MTANVTSDMSYSGLSLGNDNTFMFKNEKKELLQETLRKYFSWISKPMA